MSAIVLLFVAPLVLGLFTAGVNFSVWFNRREERQHRELAIAAIASSFLLIGSGLMYASDSRAEAAFARTALALLGIPIFLGNLRLMQRVYRRDMRLHSVLTVASLLGWALLGCIPGVLYGDGSVLRGSGVLGLRYVDVVLTPLGRFAPITTVAAAAAAIWHTRLAGLEGPDRKLVIGMLAGAGATVTSDMCVLAGFIDAPFLAAPAFTFANIVFTSLLLRQFVGVIERVEASTDLLQLAAEGRARELRETDLRLAHGARLAALGTLAAGLAHEINNPVAFIRSNLNYLGELARSDCDDPELEEVLAETEEGVARLRGIVTELLRMSSQGGAGFGDVNLSEVVESALPTLRFEARDDVAIDARLACVLAVRGDRNLLGQVVANLVINAIQAVRAKGGGGAVQIATYADDRRAVLEVSDSGPGVSPEIAQRIFEPFFTTKPAGEGTGLGLAVTRQLVERHGGRLTLAPSERGARFQVELPLGLEAPLAEAGPRSANH